MKHLKIILTFVCTIIMLNTLSAQQCQGENPVTMVLKGYKKDYKLIANNASFVINMNDGTFSFNLSLEKFKSVDSIDAKTFLDDVFEEEYFQNLYFMAVVPFVKVDKATDKIQKINVTGNLVLGDITKVVPMDLELAYMDRDLMFDFVISLTAKDLVMVMPDKYKNILTGVIELRTDSGKLIISNY
jgi:hypothetical protein